MDKKRAKEIIMAHSCCSFANGENKLCMLCPWNKIDCVDIRLDEEVIIEAMKVLNEVDEMKRIKLSEIKISSAFANTTPSSHKMQEYRESYRENCRRQEKPIVIDKNNYLRDGYIQYLILKENGVEEATIIRRRKANKKSDKICVSHPSYKNTKTTYIFGVHYNNPKEYVWRVPYTWSLEGWESDLAIGDKITVKTKHGFKTVTITRIERLDKPPVDFFIRTVARRNIELSHKDVKIINCLNKISKAAFNIESNCEEKAETNDYCLYDDVSEINKAISNIYNLVMKC